MNGTDKFSCPVISIPRGTPSLAVCGSPSLRHPRFALLARPPARPSSLIALESAWLVSPIEHLLPLLPTCVWCRLMIALELGVSTDGQTLSIEPLD